MIRKYRKTLIFTSLLTLFPILVGLVLRDQLPEVMATHWGFDGQANSWTSTATAIFVMPLIMLAFHWLCVWITSVLDKSNRDKNEKVQKLVFWIIPVLSNFVCAMAYAVALGKDFAPMGPVALMGILFIVLGNYMPKTRMNSTIGIKIFWTYTSEENWNATHRFAGKVWVIGGIAMLFSMALPTAWAVAVMLLSIFVLVILPLAYSYRYYRMQKARGDILNPMPPVFPKGSKFSMIIVVLILAGVLVVMFTGSIDVSYQEDYFTVTGTYHGSMTVFYDVVDSVEYREGNIPGIRTWGFGSGRLLMGTFENEEFGRYTRYTYTNPDACVVVTSGDNVLVISGKTAAETKAIYDNLSVLTGNN